MLGCSTDDPISELPCVTVDTECDPQYVPTFDNFVVNTLTTKCAVPGGACHSTAGAQGDLPLEVADETDYDALHATLLEDAGRGARIIPSDPGCSLLVKRLEAEDHNAAMPPGAPLKQEERCAIIQWISAGAKR